MAEYINREALIDAIERIDWFHTNENGVLVEGGTSDMDTYLPTDAVNEAIRSISAADVVELPETGIGDLSDGFHTFNWLYYQRMNLFAALVKAHKGRAWKSYRHEDGELCFGGGWFIVGIDTPEGSYTYHYENKDFDLFDCKVLDKAPHWDGHTEKDVTRLLTLPDVVERKKGKWIIDESESASWYCSECGRHAYGCFSEIYSGEYHYCPNCGAEMREEQT